MDAELFLFGLLPIILSSFILVMSIKISLKKLNRNAVLNRVLTFFIISLNSFGLIFLIQILFGAYPSYIAHVFIGITLPLFAWQCIIFAKDK